MPTVAQVILALAIVAGIVLAVTRLEEWSERRADRLTACTCDDCRALPDWDGGES